MTEDHRLFIRGFSTEETAVNVAAFVEEAGFKVVDSFVVYDKETRQSRGFGFVSLSPESDVAEAIKTLNGKSLRKRELQVSIALPRPQRDHQRTNNNLTPESEFGSPGPGGRVENLPTVPNSRNGPEIFSLGAKTK